MNDQVLGLVRTHKGAWVQQRWCQRPLLHRGSVQPMGFICRGRSGNFGSGPFWDVMLTPEASPYRRSNAILNPHDQALAGGLVSGSSDGSRIAHKGNGVSHSPEHYVQPLSSNFAPWWQGVRRRHHMVVDSFNEAFVNCLAGTSPPCEIPLVVYATSKACTEVTVVSLSPGLLSVYHSM